MVNTGNVFESVTDFATVGADSLSFTRYYNSQGRTFSSLGYDWRSNFDSQINFPGQSPGSASWVFVILPDGTTYEFDNNSGVWAAHDKDEDGKLTTDGSTVWTYTDHNDVVYNYDFTTGRLLSITNRSGYQQTLTYDTNGNLSTVTDSLGRTLTFAFLNGVLNTLTDPGGNVITYNYNTVLNSNPDQLASVAYPGTGTPTIQYKYENTTYPLALTGIIDENGNRYATWSYDANMRGASSVMGSGVNTNSLSYSLDSIGEGTVTLTNALGKQSIYTLGYLQNVGKITQIAEQASANTAAATVTYGYDSNGYINSYTDENGNVTQYTNDSRGEETSRTEGYGTAQARTITTTWDSTYHLPDTICDANLLRTDFTYTSGLLTKLTQTDATTLTNCTLTTPLPAQRIWNYTYYSNGLLNTVEGPFGAGDTVTYVYNTNGYVSSITDQVGHVTTITSWNGWGEPLTSVDPNSVTTNYTYDLRGRLKSITRNPGSSQAVTSFTYDNAGEITLITLPDSSTLTYGYDYAHRLTSVTNNLGESITYTLNAMGGRTATVTKNASSTVTKTQTAVFDELNRVMQNIGANSQTTTRAYDKDSNEITTTDPRSKIYGHAFDALNRLYQETDPDTYQTTTAYNGKSEVTSVTDARTHATTYTRDGFGDITSQTSPDTGTTTMSYDALGDLTTKIDARSNETDYTYDTTGRMLTRKIHGTSAENVTLTYDTVVSGQYNVGHLRKVADPSGSTTFNYNQLAQTTKETRVIGANSYATSFTYDPAGHILTMTYPSGRIVTYTRDALGRISGITTKQNSGSSAVTVASSVAYKPFGPLAGLTFGNSVVLSLGYDQDYELTGISASKGATVIQNLTNAYDADGNISSIADTLTPARNQSFTYDNLNRLKTASGLYGSLTYTYDSVGNRKTLATGSSTDTYTIATANNRVSKVTSSPSGNVRTFTYLATGQASGDTRNPSSAYVYTYNKTGRLSSASLNGSTVGTYLMNGMEQRVSKVVGSTTTQFVFDRFGHLLAEASGSTGATQKEYIWLDDLPVAEIDNTGSSPVIYYVHTDHLGRPQKMTDATATIVWDGVFDPFGNVTSITGSTTNLLMFPGQYYDSETQLSQNWNRDYDPSIGRYIQSDPIGLKGGVNTYAYVKGNPLKAIDRMGLVSTNCFSDCEKQAQADEAVCGRLSDPGARSRCWQSATARYGACRANKPLPPLITWRDGLPDSPIVPVFPVDPVPILPFDFPMPIPVFP